MFKTSSHELVEVFMSGHDMKFSYDGWRQTSEQEVGRKMFVNFRTFSFHQELFVTKGQASRNQQSILQRLSKQCGHCSPQLVSFLLCNFFPFQKNILCFYIRRNRPERIFSLREDTKRNFTKYFSLLKCFYVVICI